MKEKKQNREKGNKSMCSYCYKYSYVSAIGKLFKKKIAV